MMHGDRMIVVSPHLDDAVFGCGELMARVPGALCVTVFAGLPSDPEVLTGWDRDSGYASALEALACRRGEDMAALRLLQAEPAWLPFTDDQYGEQPDSTERDIATALDNLIACHLPRAIVIPLGLFHRDHELAHRAAVRALSRWPQIQWVAYEDALYRRIPGLVRARTAALAAWGIQAAPLHRLPVSPGSAKRRAVERYASQLQALARPGGPGCGDLYAPEVCWSLRAMPSPAHPFKAAS